MSEAEKTNEAKGPQSPGRSALQSTFIGIAGLIGAGKTTLADALGEHLGLDVHYEPVIDNEYLDDFYRETAKYAFAMQIYLLNRRFKQHQEIIWRGRGGVQDRTIYEDAIFAKTLRDSGMMDARDYATYVDLFRNMSNFMCRPNMIVYLDVTPEISMERIRERSRGCEVGIDIAYLAALRENYEEFLSEVSRIMPVIRVDYDEFWDTEKLATAVTRQYTETNFLRELPRIA